MTAETTGAEKTCAGTTGAENKPGGKPSAVATGNAVMTMPERIVMHTTTVTIVTIVTTVAKVTPA